MIPKSLLMVKIGMETKFPAYMKNGEHHWIEEKTQYMQSRILVFREERCISTDLGIYCYRYDGNTHFQKTGNTIKGILALW